MDAFGAMLDAHVARLPKELFKELNLGIGVVEHAKHDRRGLPGQPLYILGEYRVHPVMGRGILLYYGSFLQAYPQHSEEAISQQIDRVLKHELTHHLESLAGSRELEIADAQRLLRWREGEEG